tara:strand:+ start:709 stop:1716 length:1008 start_codon:yes stop_codon:yes gene_type:complete
MEFRYPLVLLMIFFQIILFFIIKIFDKKEQKKLFPRAVESVKNSILSGLDKNKIRWKNRFIIFGLILLSIAATGPKIGTKFRPVERKGVDIVIALDTSASMDAEDVKPSRISKAKFELNNLIKKLKGDRVAIIVFAGTSHLYLPLTTDYETALLFLNDIDTEIIPTQGTALSKAIKTGINAFTDEKDKHKIMLLVSDGEDHEGEAVELASMSKKNGLKIFTVGVGSELGGLIPEKNRHDKITKYKRSSDGKLITTKMNNSILKEISNSGGGKFFWFDNNRDTHLQIISAIDRMDKKIISSHEYFEYEDQYQIFLFFSFVFFLLGFTYPTLKKIEQ